MNRWGALCALVAIAGLRLAGGAETVSTERSAQIMTPSTSSSLGIRVFEALAAVDSPHNVAVSPRSLETALQLLYWGSSGHTRAALGAALGLNASATPEPFAAITAAGVRFQSSSSVWTRADVAVLPAFLDAARRCCGATSLPLPSEGAATAINRWVAAATEGKILNIVSSVGPNVSLLLVNAAYFRATWTAQFDSHVSQLGPFLLGNGETRTVPFMRRVGEFAHAHESTFDWIRIPYGDGRIAMDLLMPARNSSAVGLLDTLLSVGDPHSSRARALATGSLELPRFTMETASPLNKALASLGLGDLFKLGSADFSRLTSGPTGLAVDEVRHSVAITVDESGTEAAAATSVTMVGSLPPAALQFDLRLDHPFLLAIRDSQDGAVLFVALIRDPASR